MENFSVLGDFAARVNSLLGRLEPARVDRPRGVRRSQHTLEANFVAAAFVPLKASV